MWRLKKQEENKMISKEKKQAIMAEYARTEGDTGLLAYLKKTDIERYRALIEKLGIRK